MFSTIHAANGAQCSQVIVLNVVDGCIPLSVGGRISDLERERNLLYVACTRASERLYLMEAPRKGKAERSPFLADKKMLGLGLNPWNHAPRNDHVEFSVPAGTRRGTPDAVVRGELDV